MLPRDHYLKQAFQDPINFPDGFEKGGLSDIQARLVRKNGALISALIVDEVSDATPDDLHILKVIANHSAPKSPVEQAWMKYINVVKKLQAANSSKAKTKAKPAKATIEKADDDVSVTEKPAKAPSAKASKTTTKEEPAKKPTAKPKKAEQEEKPSKAKK